MKKFAVLFTAMLFALVSFGQYINRTEGTSFTFTPPDGATTKVTSPLFPTAKVTTYSFATNDTLTYAVKNFYEYINVATLAGSFWLNVTINSKITPGAMLILKFTADGSNRKAYLKTGFANDSVAVSANTIKKVIAVYDGTSYNVIQ